MSDDAHLFILNDAVVGHIIVSTNPFRDPCNDHVPKKKISTFFFF